MRIGQGFDAHAFDVRGHLVLGGVAIPHHVGLKAHSDGDVVLHALCDALLGAAGLGDIGQHFPDTEAAYKGADSRILLRQVVSLLQEEGFKPHNVDITVVAQEPKLAPYREPMQATIAADVGLSVSSVNVKATTTEGMGFTGRKEGIAAFAVVLIE